MHTMDRLIRRIFCKTLTLGIALAATAGCGGGQERVGTELSFSIYSSPSELARSSEYLLRVTIDKNSELQEVLIGENSPPSSNTPLAFYESSGIVTHIFAQRPDVSEEVEVGEKVRFGQVLLSEWSLEEFGNAAEPSYEFPSGKDRVVGGQDLLIFAVLRHDISGSKYFEIGGYGSIHEGGKKVLFGGFPGSLSGTKADLRSVVDSVLDEYLGEGPWRSSDSTIPFGDEDPHDSGPPTSIGGP